jgi:hypothetical protein
MMTLLEPTHRRKYATTEGQVDKRGRARGFLGWFRGHPWATRKMILTTTYTSSYLEYYKGDELRDRIDSSAQTNDDITKAGGRAFCINVTLKSGEVLMLSPYTHDERQTWLHRLNVAGLIPTAADRMAQQYSLNCLSELHESVAYTYFVFKSKNAIQISQLKGYYEAASEAINITGRFDHIHITSSLVSYETMSNIILFSASALRSFYSYIPHFPSLSFLHYAHYLPKPSPSFMISPCILSYR